MTSRFSGTRAYSGSIPTTVPVVSGEPPGLALRIASVGLADPPEGGLAGLQVGRPAQVLAERPEGDGVAAGEGRGLGDQAVGVGHGPVVGAGQLGDQEQAAGDRRAGSVASSASLGTTRTSQPTRRSRAGSASGARTAVKNQG